MAYRALSDRTGTEWRVWAVYAADNDRRVGPDRRSAPAPDPIVERRRTVERRQYADSQPPHIAGVAPPLAEGWLCFQASDAHGVVRRRLAPIPPDWRDCADDVLLGHLERAAVVPARARTAEGARTA